MWVRFSINSRDKLDLSYSYTRRDRYSHFAIYWYKELAYKCVIRNASNEGICIEFWRKNLGLPTFKLPIANIFDDFSI